MLYRRLGKTEFMVSEVSFGAHVDEVNVKDEKRRAEQITAGLEHGINLFDIYDHSGYKQWEPMSTLLHTIRDRVVISLCTVWNADKVLDEIDHALKVFRTGYIDLYRFVLGKNADENEMRLHALIKEKEKGKVKAVGAAVHVPSETLKALRKHGEELDFLMAPIAYCFRRAVREKSLIAREVRDHGIGIVAMKPLWSHADDRGAGSHMFHLPAPAVQLAGLEGGKFTVGRLALQAVLESDLVSTVMPTMNSVEEVLEDVKASGAGPLKEDERKLLNLYWEELQRQRKDFLKPHEWLWNWR